MSIITILTFDVKQNYFQGDIFNIQIETSITNNHLATYNWVHEIFQQMFAD